MENKIILKVLNSDYLFGVAKELFKNNKKIILMLPEEKGIKVEFETSGFGKIEGKISTTSWSKIQEFETKYEQEN